MKLYSRTFERALRRDVRRKVWASSELKREFKRANKFRKHYQINTLIRPCASVCVAFLVWSVYSATGHVATALAVLSLWTLAMTFYRAQNFAGCLATDPDLAAFSVLPMPAPLVFRRQMRKFLVKSLFALADLLVGLAVLGWAAKFSFGQWLLVPPVTVAAWGTILALAIFCAVRMSRFVGVAVGIASFGWVAVIFLEKIFPLKSLLKLLDQSADWVNLFLPTGWSLNLLMPFIEPGRWLALGTSFPLALLCWTAWKMIVQLRAEYFFTEIPTDAAPDLWPTAEVPVENTIAGERPKHFGDDTIVEIVQTRLFLAVPTWRERGRLEKWLWHWLRPREKIVLEMACPLGITISVQWKKVFRNLILGLAASFGIGYFSSGLTPWLAGFSIFASSVPALMLMLDSGRAFQPVFCSGVNVPLYALYGVGFRELSRSFFKCWCVQLPLLILWSSVCGAAVGHLAGTTVLEGLVHGSLMGLVIFAAKFGLMVFEFSRITNDSSKGGIKGLFVFGIISILGLAYLILGIIGPLLPISLPGLLVVLLSMLAALSMFWIYGWFYRKSRFDLMSLPSQ